MGARKLIIDREEKREKAERKKERKAKALRERNAKRRAELKLKSFKTGLTHGEFSGRNQAQEAWRKRLEYHAAFKKAAEKEMKKHLSRWTKTIERANVVDKLLPPPVP